MPTFGTLETGRVADRLPAMRDLDTEAWALPGAEILQLAFEVPRATAALLPRAMHPAIPPYATIWVIRYPESPVGPFTLAQLRLMGRAGAHPRDRSGAGPDLFHHRQPGPRSERRRSQGR